VDTGPRAIGGAMCPAFPSLVRGLKDYPHRPTFIQSHIIHTESERVATSRANTLIGVYPLTARRGNLRCVWARRLSLLNFSNSFHGFRWAVWICVGSTSSGACLRLKPALASVTIQTRLPRVSPLLLL